MSRSPRTSRRRSFLTGLLAVLVAGSMFPMESQLLRTITTAAPGSSPPLGLDADLLIDVVRTGASEASVSGVAISVSDTVELLVDGNVVATGSPIWILDYSFLHVPVSNSSTVQTRIGLLVSPVVTVPPYVPQRRGAPGFVYAQGTQLILDGSPIQMFGVNDDMGFIYTYWGTYGRNYVFPDFDGTISGVSTPDAFWHAYFRYFLHYQQVGSPRPNLLRVTVGWDFGSEETYYAWKNDPAGYFADFDSMVRWAKAAGVYLVPMLWQGPTDRPYVPEYFDTTSARYAHLIEFERGMMSKYANEPTIAMWDVFNEADTEPTWGSRGGFAAFKAWEQRLVDDVRDATSQLITVGHGMTSADAHFPSDGFGFNHRWYNAFSDINGVDVTHIHSYGTAEDQYLIDWMQGWTSALGRPMFVGELAYNEYPSPVGSPYPMGHWPWHTNTWLAADIGPVAEMTWLDNGKGAYADYPYYGALPDYPSGSFDFALSLSPASGSVVQGSPSTTSATVTLTSGTSQSVGLSCSGLPSGASCAFNPVGGTPTYSSTLTIATASTTPTGTHPIVVTATGGRVTRNATYSLTVTSPATPCPPSPPSYPSSSWDRVWCDSSFSAKLADGPDEALEKFDTDWGRGAVAGIRADDIGFRSGRTINLPVAGAYDFAVGGDDGVRLWIDGTLVLDMWFQQPYTVYNLTRSLGAGSHQLRLDYYEGPFDARVSFTFSPGMAIDVTPPARVTDLGATAVYTVSVTLQWTAPGDDGATGTASRYNLRYSSQGPLTEANFSSASPVVSPPPSPAGSIEVVNVTGLSPGTRYWFGLRTADEVPNWSILSNVAEAVTRTPGPPPDTTPPSRVSDLTAVPTGTASIALQWTAPGDDGASGLASSYDVRYSSAGPLDDTNFALATPVPAPVPGPAGTTEMLSLSGLSPGTRYWFALKTADEVPNWSPLSNVADATTQTPPPPDTTPPDVGILAPGNGSTVSGDVQVSAWATDDTSLESVSLYADQLLVGVRPAPPWAWILSTGGLADGMHRLSVVASDTSGNLGSATADIRVQNAPTTAPRVIFTAWDAAHSRVEILFSKPMNRTSVETNLRLEPATGHGVSWADDTRAFLMVPGPLVEGQTYIVTVGPGATDAEAVPLPEGFRFEFLPVPRSTPSLPLTTFEFGLFIVAILALIGLAGRRRRRATRRRSNARSGARWARPEPSLRVHGPVSAEDAETAPAIVDEDDLEPPQSAPRRTGRAGADLQSLMVWLEEVEREIATPTAGLASPASSLSAEDANLGSSLHAPEDGPLRGTTKTSVPRPGAWTEIRARSAIERYLRDRPWARAKDIARDLGIDLGLASRVTISLRGERSG